MTVQDLTTDLLAGPLSVAMREGSRAEHERTESSSFVEALLAGEVSGDEYAGYLKRLRTVYLALESVGRASASDPAVAAVWDPALERVAALDSDIAFWAADPAAPVHSPAAESYALRVRSAAQWGGLYLAHHYTRYLGDLSGGQVIGRALTRRFGLSAAAGVAFYDFPEISKPKPYKDAYRARLDGLALDVAQRRRVVDEVKVAFCLNQALFDELVDQSSQPDQSSGSGQSPQPIGKTSNAVAKATPIR
jgi:heme oxygenase